MFVKKEWRYFLQSVHKGYSIPFGSCKVLPNAWMDTKVFLTLHMTFATIIFLYNYLGVESCGRILCCLITSIFFGSATSHSPSSKDDCSWAKRSFICVCFLEKLTFVFILM